MSDQVYVDARAIFEIMASNACGQVSEEAVVELARFEAAMAELSRIPRCCSWCGEVRAYGDPRWPAYCSEWCESHGAGYRTDHICTACGKTYRERWIWRLMGEALCFDCCVARSRRRWHLDSGRVGFA